MTSMRIIATAVLAALAACSAEQPRQTEADTRTQSAGADRAPSVAAPTPSAPSPQRAAAAEPSRLIGEALALAEWRKAANRDSCAPLALASDGGVPAAARRAEFSSGWAVAFDAPGRRSAYGFSGTGLLPEDDTTGHDYKVGVIRRQWPYGHDPAGLPKGSFAGYGREGARPYAPGNPQGRGQQSLAYLRIPGQAWLYNVWSRVSRRHLEDLLASLRLVGS